MSAGIGLAFALHFIFAVFIELGRSGVNGQNNVVARFVAGVFNRVDDKGQSFFGRLQVRCETAFIADVGVVSGSFQVLFQRVENFGTHANGFFNGGSGNRHNHEFLNVNRVVGMLAAVNDVHHRNRQSAGHGAAQITIQRETGFFGLSLGNGERNGQDGVSAELAFVFGAVEFNHGSVDFNLIFGVQTGQSVVDGVVDVGNGFFNAFAAETLFVAVTEFNGFVYAGRSAGRNGCASESTGLQNNIGFNSRISARV